MNVLTAPNMARARLSARAFAVAALVVMLPACTALASRGSAAQRMALDTSFSAFEEPGRRQPLVSFPNSGPVTSVKETRNSAGLRQHIAYVGQGGVGRAELALTTATAPGDPALGKPTRIGIATELASLTPDGPYRVLTQPLNNAYGPFGIAVGSRCAYAWQWIREMQGAVFGGYISSGKPITVSLRVQHCRRGPTSPEALVADLVRLRLGVGAPVATARRVRRLQPSAIVATQPAEVEVLAPAVAPRPQAIVNGSRTLVTVTPEPSLPIGRIDPRYLAPQADPQRLPETAAIPRPGAIGSKSLEQPRYLTDLAAPAGPTRTPGPSSGLSPPPTPPTPRAEPLSPDLPSRAYHGPTPPPLGW